MTQDSDKLSESGVIIDVAVLAYNEEAVIGAFLTDLAQQSIFDVPGVDLRVLVLANGCRDATVAVARRALENMPADRAARIEIFDLEQGGKSRTVHRYIHEFSRKEADLLGFMDGDIRLPQAETLARMVQEMRKRPDLLAFTSRPEKDVVYDRKPVGFMARVIASGGGGLTDFRKSICGQLFILRAGIARRIGLPTGLPVEDGFIRAMVLTDLLSAPEDLARIDGDPEIFHVYESIRSLPELIHHQTRIVVGSAVNAALFGKLRRDAPGEGAAHAMLMASARDEDWLASTLHEELPRRPHGYVPFDFLTKRLRGSARRGLKGYVMLVVGLGLDALVYILATIRMLRRQGAHHW